VVILKNIRWVLINSLLFIFKNTVFYKYLNVILFIFGLNKKYDKAKLGSYKRNWEKEKVLREITHGPWMGLSLGILADILFILRHYLHQYKTKLARQDNSIVPKQLNDLSGSDFEAPLCKLFGAMGYEVQKTGKVDEHGCDLIINLGDQKLLLRTLRRKDSPVGDTGIQEASAAQEAYGCNGCMVISESGFNEEAVELAKVKDVGLVGKERLGELLGEYIIAL
jgi:HJR/Mrr/RecB family endonuclease